MPKISQRISAVRGEVINFLTFLSVVWELWDENEPSFITSFFVVIGILLLIIDSYFIHCQWNLQRSRSCACFVNCSVGTLDDLISDLPQTLWLISYFWYYKFSPIAIACSLHSTFSIFENLLIFHEEKQTMAEKDDTTQSLTVDFGGSGSLH
mmetsp:Transcript_26753/g.39577  ORF Transcript_26753/g.39577 Transcript_26753/m.39577 type:complete len:152 (-) Transcript_26753:1788-2243(-)